MAMWANSALLTNLRSETWTNLQLTTWNCENNVLVNWYGWPMPNAEPLGCMFIILFIFVSYSSSIKMYVKFKVQSQFLFIQKSPLKITVQLICYTGLKISTFKWNRLCGKAKYYFLLCLFVSSNTASLSWLQRACFVLISAQEGRVKIGHINFTAICALY